MCVCMSVFTVNAENFHKNDRDEIYASEYERKRWMCGDGSILDWIPVGWVEWDI